MTKNKEKKTEDLLLDINTLLEESDDINSKYKKALRILRKKLPEGWANTISEQTGKSVPMVYKVMEGGSKKKDNAIILRAIELAKGHVKGTENIIKTIKEL